MSEPQSISQNLFYGIATILFALSLISERLSNMFKLCLKETRIKTFDDAMEKIRERNIMVIALVFGLITATLSGADFFTLIEKGKLLGFLEKPDGESIAKVILGTFLSGVFISLGSKFWHDMLDIALQFSNLKKYQASKAAMTSQSAAIGNIQSKVQLAEQQLKQMDGYAGYDFNNADTSINLKFNSETLPTQKQMDWLNATFGNGNYNIQRTNIKVG